MLVFHTVDNGSDDIWKYQLRAPEFEAQGCAVVGCAVASKFTQLHACERATTEHMLGAVTVPLLCDVTGAIARLYGVFDDETGGVSTAVFVISKMR